ncbi:GNAT family N-acetyltransferase [Denitrobaculum tricleocarpae]|uniref:GNAT family N-acetyltransferase n=1 Tax=Denitrobaculum tricleocarpae TaxID=2591009 RepID=A0A545TPK9_9PROT|nr:GNAT family N-acetyltransferase [Denitrobaculum tricleocarpae]TQV79155.1 GNAT family N-acetyltransferase [Denitrobaculum tricleocarpae]
MSLEIRPLSERERLLVLDWLEREEAAPDREFAAQKDALARAEDAGELWGLFEDADPVAFLAGGLRKDGFLRVRADRRRRGYGRRLVRHRIDALRADDSCCLLDILCEPADSIPFWRKMGFTLYGGSCAFKRLERRFEVPRGAEAIAVRIRSFPDFVLRTGELVEPLDSFRPDAVILPGGNIQLAERVIFFAGPLNRRYDLVVMIEVGGRTLLFDRVSSDAAYAVGVSEDGQANHFLDRINDPPLTEIPSRR